MKFFIVHSKTKDMKNIIVTLVSTFFLSGIVSAQYDDLYDDPKDVFSPVVYLEEFYEDTDFENVSVTDDSFEQFADQPYQYSSRINRFNADLSSNYYSPIFINQGFYGDNGINTIYPAYEIYSYSPLLSTGFDDYAYRTNPQWATIAAYGSSFGNRSIGGFGTNTIGGPNASRGGYNDCPINNGRVNTPNVPSRTTPTVRTSTNSENTTRQKTNSSVLSVPKNDNPVYRAPERSSSPSSSPVPNQRETPSRSTPSRSSGSVRY